ncbi:DUF72 domain-containing protein [Noviherbaspirillum massiliense]|uniref:DUF72 domain-containing protein n=1 Tax=Noviherbaspirillum massiliense TaxID=1465823 RepID=UPI00031FAFF2|nr:DUF72 domain-containing protein [Noviherbaspirillum massiliense]
MTLDLFAAGDEKDASPGPILIGCAGWSVPGAASEHFPRQGSHLERYAAVFPAVEINTSFYRPHRPASYARWRESVPSAFRFSVKMPRTITHQLRLRNAENELTRFLDEVGHLEEKLGCLLVQLPPSLRYEATAAEPFFDQLRALTQVPVVCEARHATWFAPQAAAMLAQHGIAYVMADPPIVPLLPEADRETVYVRLHGSPRMYYSAYSEEYLERQAAELDTHARLGRRVWCIFDNTAEGAAVPNALSVLARVAK